MTTPANILTPEQVAAIRRRNADGRQRPGESLGNYVNRFVQLRPFSSDEIDGLLNLLAARDQEIAVLTSCNTGLTKAVDERDRTIAELDGRVKKLREWIADISDTAQAHHHDQPASVLMHSLQVDIPAMCNGALAADAGELSYLDNHEAAGERKGEQP